MRIAALIARLLLGLIFLVFGLNGFLHFIPMPPPSGLAGDYMAVMSKSHYMVFVFLLQIVGGALLLAGQYIPLALAMLAPVILNIVLYHALMAPEGLPVAAVTLVLWVFLFFRHFVAFAPLFSNPRT